jgi:hypothetical protein
MLIGDGPAQRGIAVHLTGTRQFCGILSSKDGSRRFSREPLAPTSPPRKNSSCRMKNACPGFAIGSPQRNHKRLMFSAAGLGDPALSTSRYFGFCIVPRGDRAARRLACGASASTDG